MAFLFDAGLWGHCPLVTVGELLAVRSTCSLYHDDDDDDKSEWELILKKIIQLTKLINRNYKIN